MSIEMAQAKTLNERELKNVLATVSIGRNAARNRCIILMSMWSGMRVGELAALKNADVIKLMARSKMKYA